jgi:ribosomal protein S5
LHQALVEDTAKAVGLAAGNASDAAAAAQDAVAAAKEKLADAQWQMDSGDAPNIPAEAYTNTEDLIRARQAEAAQEAARGTAYRGPAGRGDPV